MGSLLLRPGGTLQIANPVLSSRCFTRTDSLHDTAVPHQPLSHAVDMQTSDIWPSWSSHHKYPRRNQLNSCCVPSFIQGPEVSILQPAYLALSTHWLAGGSPWDETRRILHTVPYFFNFMIYFSFLPFIMDLFQWNVNGFHKVSWIAGPYSLL
jgi:hypothetical protein